MRQYNRSNISMKIIKDNVSNVFLNDITKAYIYTNIDFQNDNDFKINN